MAGKDGSEKIEYMFVDIEWYQTPGAKGIENRDLIQIARVDEFVCKYDERNAQVFLWSEQLL